MSGIDLRLPSVLFLNDFWKTDNPRNSRPAFCCASNIGCPVGDRKVHQSWHQGCQRWLQANAQEEKDDRSDHHQPHCNKWWCVHQKIRRVKKRWYTKIVRENKCIIPKSMFKQHLWSIMNFSILRVFQAIPVFLLLFNMWNLRTCTHLSIVQKPPVTFHHTDQFI